LRFVSTPATLLDPLNRLVDPGGLLMPFTNVFLLNTVVVAGCLACSPGIGMAARSAPGPAQDQRASDASAAPKPESGTNAAGDVEPLVRVFIFAGQSNAVGMAKNPLWNTQAELPETKKFFSHLRQGNTWIARDDVLLKFREQAGPLTLGSGAGGRCTGAELEFGWVLGDHFDDPVLIIKTAWGGRSLVKNFRPPSSPPDQAVLAKELAAAQEAVRKANEQSGKNEPLPTMEDIGKGYGNCYRDMMAEIEHVLANAGTVFPQLAGRRPELAGFVWFQGWNDQYGGAEKEYAAHLRNLINDVRRELDAPQLPVVIAVMGQNGSTPATGPMKVIQGAQLAVPESPEFRDTVRAVRTDVLVDTRAERLVEGWRDHLEEWNKTGSDYGYHYYGSAIWYTRIGRALGEAMLELLGEKR
jgi:hypothetical protein